MNKKTEMIKRLFRKRNRAEINEKRYRSWLKKYEPKSTNHRIELVRVFTDRNDNNYYVARDMGAITRERTRRIEECMLSIEWSVPKSEIETKLSGILETIKSAPYSNMTPQKLRTFVESSTNEINDILFRMKTISDDDLLIESGLYFFYIDGENPYVIDPGIQKQKNDNVRNDPELRSFFLNTIEQILIVSANGSEADSKE
jgi:hypothetical protein